MVDQAVPPLSIAEAKARLLNTGEPSLGGPSLPKSWALPAVGAAVLAGFLLARRRRRGVGLFSLGALAMTPAVRSMVVAAASTAIRRYLSNRPAR